jgi:tRNA modification GTPase
MYQFKSLEDTIAAISTSLGQGGIGIVRLSGKEALAIADGMFVSRRGRKPSSFKTFTVHYGDIVTKGQVIDEALLTVMRAPASYTKEDVVEISSHGGTVSLRVILKLATDLGARPAEPGEFTKRAFLNGRIDLAQAEAVMDVIRAKTEAFLRVSTHQMKGELSSRLERIRAGLMDIYAGMEAVVNFPEDDVAPRDTAVFLSGIETAREDIARLLASSEHGRILKDGIKIVICGKPNVGKSSLLNAFLKQPRAIVSPIAGTTRDTIEETAQIKGIPFQLIDTAGLLDPRDLIEEEAVKRSHLSIEAADLVLFLLDAATGIEPEDRKVFGLIKGRPVFLVFNKCDLGERLSEEEIRRAFPKGEIVRISALKNEGIERLEERIVERVWHGKDIETSGVLVSNLRHVNALQACRAAVGRAAHSLSEGLPLEFVSEEIRLAVNFLDNITGRNIDEDLLEAIFSQFCIGK